MGARPIPRWQSTRSGLVAEMIELARRFGADPAFVRAGGGNSSAKADGVLYIKPSGVSLATIRRILRPHSTPGDNSLRTGTHLSS